MNQNIEKEINNLRNSINEMFSLVNQQIINVDKAFFDVDEQKAEAIICREQRVNAYELNIDSACEDIIALYAPVAIDLRLVLSFLKINTNLERIGDFARGIATVISQSKDRGLSDVVIAEAAPQMK